MSAECTCPHVVNDGVVFPMVIDKRCPQHGRSSEGAPMSEPGPKEVADKSAVERCHEAFALAWDANNFLSSHKRDFAAIFANGFSFGAQYAVGRLAKELSKEFANFPEQWHATYPATEAMPAKPKRVRKKKQAYRPRSRAHRQ